MKRITLSLLSLCALTFSVSAADPSTATPTPVNNTAKNERDRSGDTKTSGDQSNSSADIKTTAAIRRAVVGDGSLSMLAKNVKIITANGVVTLRGPVNTAAEKTKIAQLAQANAGKAKIVDQLEVKMSNQSEKPSKQQH
ncbi:MAG: BON domain-containing protein [Chthoniobacterales bacterium]